MKLIKYNLYYIIAVHIKQYKNNTISFQITINQSKTFEKLKS